MELVSNKLKIIVNNNQRLLTSSVVSPYIMVKGDSVASIHYWREEDKQCLTNIKYFNGPSILLPNNSKITADRKGQLPLLKKLSTQA